MTHERLFEACQMVGGQAALARILRVTPPTVNQWINGDRPIPAERCPDIERASGGAVTCEQLRPDLAEQWAYLRGTKPINEPSQEAA